MALKSLASLIAVVELHPSLVAEISANQAIQVLQQSTGLAAAIVGFGSGVMHVREPLIGPSSAGFQQPATSNSRVAPWAALHVPTPSHRPGMRAIGRGHARPNVASPAAPGAADRSVSAFRDLSRRVSRSLSQQLRFARARSARHGRTLKHLHIGQQRRHRCVARQPHAVHRGILPCATLDNSGSSQSIDATPPPTTITAARRISEALFDELYDLFPLDVRVTDESSADELLLLPPATQRTETQRVTDRDLACAKALQQPSLAAVFARIEADPMAHYLTKTYSYRKFTKDGAALRRRPPATDPTSLFQSNRNCKRYVHAFLSLRQRHGRDFVITDAMLKTEWRHLEATCDYGIQNRVEALGGHV